MNIFIQFYMYYLSSNAVGESLIVHFLQNMTARINILPFQRKIKRRKGPVYVDFGRLMTKYPIVSTMAGIFKSVKYSFTVTTL